MPRVCVRTVLLYGSETWALSTEDLGRIKRCDHAMIRWLCNVKIEQKHTTDDLHYERKVSDGKTFGFFSVRIFFRPKFDLVRKFFRPKFSVFQYFLRKVFQ